MPSFGYIPRKRKISDLLYRILGINNLIRKVQAPYIMKYLELGQKDVVLDAGCGGGFFTYEISHRVSKVYGIDHRMKIDKFDLKKANCCYIRADALRLPFKDGNFDKVLLSSVLPMVNSDHQLLKEIIRVTKPLGKIIITVPMGYIYLPQLFKFFKKDYIIFNTKLMKNFGTSNKGYYDQKEISDLINQFGLIVEEKELIPKKVMSFIYELIFLPARIKTGNNFFVMSILTLLLYPVSYFDRLFFRNSNGNEIIFKLRKNNECMG